MSQPQTARAVAAASRAEPGTRPARPPPAHLAAADSSAMAPLAPAPAPVAAAATLPAATTEGLARARLLEQRARQQAVAARLGEMALAGAPLRQLAETVVREVTTLYADTDCGIGELLGEGKYRLVAGTGWMALQGDRAIAYDSGTGSQPRYHLASPQATVIHDLQAETRFRASPALVANGVRGAVCAVIPGHDRAWGTFGLFAPRPGRFGPEDAAFVGSLVQILSSAVRRAATEHSLAARVRQQAALARLGQAALRQDLHGLMDVAAREVAHALDADCCKVLELDRDGRILLLRAGVGWREGLVGSATVPADTHSQAGYALRSDRAVIVDDLAGETRFEPASLLLDHGVVSGISVIIRGVDSPYGVLGVHSRQRRAFSRDDIDVVETAAALLAAAIERHRVQEQLRRHRSHLEEEVAERTRQLAASNRELEAFSYSVSHDLRAPLRTITGYSTLLLGRHGPALGPEGQELLTGVRRSAERLGQLIDDLLDLSRVQRVDLAQERIDLTALCQQTLAGLAAGDPGRTVACAVQPGLTVHGDPRLIGMLVENLLGNAWKFTRRTKDARIEVLRQGSGPDEAFVVKDNGAGLDMAYAGRLFQPFQRLHRPSEFEGTGIGLATVKRIVERHGGRVWVEGRPGAGATFYFVLGT